MCAQTGQLYVFDEFHTKASHDRASVRPFAIHRARARDAKAWLDQIVAVCCKPNGDGVFDCAVYCPLGAFAVRLPASLKDKLPSFCAHVGMNAFTGGYLYRKIIIVCDELFFAFRQNLFKGQSYTVVRPVVRPVPFPLPLPHAHDNLRIPRSNNLSKIERPPTPTTNPNSPSCSVRSSHSASQCELRPHGCVPTSSA